MGCLLFRSRQRSVHAGRLDRIVSQLTRRAGTSSNFATRVGGRRVFDAFRAHGIIFVRPARRGCRTTREDSGRFTCFHGVARWYRHDYTRAELPAWADRII
jgi:uncharacterized protein YecE (DUF72 family)